MIAIAMTYLEQNDREIMQLEGNDGEMMKPEGSECWRNGIVQEK